MSDLCPVLKQRFFDANGLPLAGGQIYTYAAGTTTPLATYTDQSGGTPNANPIVLDSQGYANVWLGPNVYKFVLYDAHNNLQFTVDNVYSLAYQISTGGLLTTLGDIIYASGTNTAARLPGNTSLTKKYLSQTGTGSVSAAPAWSQPAFSEISGSLNLATQVTGNLSVNNLDSGSLASSSTFWRGDGTWSPLSIPLTTKTSNYTLTSNDAIVLANASGAFTLTLPTAVGIAGKVFYLKKIDSTTNVVAIATTSSQTIDGSTTVNFATQYEEWSVVSDGSNWQVLNHKATTPVSNSLSFTFGGIGTPTAVDVRYKREGDILAVTGKALTGTVAASVLSIILPSNLTIDSSKITSDADTQTVGNFFRGFSGGGFASTSSGPWTVFYDGSTTDRVFISSATGSASFNKQNGNAILTSGDLISFQFWIPISGWSN